jgi:CRP/FNR family transcriptional regulator, anaerobic regulatory protein
MLLSEAPALPHAAEAIQPALARPSRDTSCETGSDICRTPSLNFCAALSGDGHRIAATHRSVAARHNLYRAGEASDGVQVVCEGWAVRFLQLPDGKRQILAVVMPGDLISAGAMFERQFSFSVQAVTRVHYCIFPFAEVRSRLRDDPALLDAWLALAAAEHRDADRRLVDLGQRSALERIASLIMQVMLRSEERGAVADGEFALPMSQQQMADFTGLTPVHTCRVLSALRKTGLCEVGHGTVKVRDRTELQRLAALK